MKFIKGVNIKATGVMASLVSLSLCVSYLFLHALFLYEWQNSKSDLTKKIKFIYILNTFFFILQKDINPKGLYVFYQNGSDSNTNFFQLAQFPLELEEKVSM